MSTPTTESLPIWNERERPTAYLIDMHQPDRDYAVLPDDKTSTHADYLAWVNGHKEPLHAAFRKIHPTAADSLAARQIEIEAIAHTVAEITQQEPYPVQRIVIAEHANGLPPYEAAIEDGLLERPLSFHDGTPTTAQFECALHFIRMQHAHIQKAQRTDLIDTCAYALGQATLSRVAYANLEPTSDGTTTYHWHGYAWRYDGAYFGELLNEASAVRIAAETRQRMYTFMPGNAAVHPFIETYRGTTGVDPMAVGAIALDVLNYAAGNQDPLAIYRPLWEYIASGQQDAARQQLADMVNYATRGSMQLEALEAHPYSSNGLSFDMLKKVEERCGIDVSMRPSRYLLAANE